MALPINTAWEVRPTVGNDSNGGGFVPGSSGTDYSQQTSPQYALTGVTSAGSGNVVLSASAASDMVGNIAQVTGGTNFTTGFYKVVSVSVGVSITFSTNNASGSICSGVGAAGVINIGGALATISAAYAASSTSNVIWVKATGSYTVTSTLQINTNNSPIAMRMVGYTTTRGDNGRVTWTTATNSTALVNTGSGHAIGFSFENFNFTTSAGTPAQAFKSSNDQPGTWRWKNCKFSGGFSIAVDGQQAAIPGFIMESCIVTGCTSHGVTAASGLFIGCLIHGNGGDGVNITPANGIVGALYGPVIFVDSVMYNNSSNGVFCDPNASGNVVGVNFTWVQFFNCALVGNAGDGFKVNSNGFNGTNQLWAYNTIAYGNGAYGFYTGSSNFIIYAGRNNAFGANTSGPYTDLNTLGIFTAQDGDVSLTADPFTNSSGLDFSLNSTTGGGAALKAAGYPGIAPFATAYNDIGPAQHQDSGGGGGGSVLPIGSSGSGMNGGI